MLIALLLGGAGSSLNGIPSGAPFCVVSRDCEVQMVFKGVSTPFSVPVHLKRGDVLRLTSVDQNAARAEVARGVAEITISPDEILTANADELSSDRVEQMNALLARTDDRIVYEATNWLKAERARLVNQPLSRVEIESLNLRELHRNLNGEIMFGIASDGVPVGSVPAGFSAIKQTRSFKEQLALEQSGKLSSRKVEANARLAAESELQPRAEFPRPKIPPAVQSDTHEIEKTDLRRQIDQARWEAYKRQGERDMKAWKENRRQELFDRNTLPMPVTADPNDTVASLQQQRDKERVEEKNRQDKRNAEAWKENRPQEWPPP